MLIFTETFDYAGQQIFDILARVLKFSVERNCPTAKFELFKTKAPALNHSQAIKARSGYRACISNTVKLEKWVETVDKANDDVILMDCDMLVLKDLHHVFKDYQFDIALCRRTQNVQKRMPYNGGIVFVRNTQAAKDFMHLWLDINNKLLNNVSEHNKWRAKYAGMNQAAFGYITEKCKFDAKLKYLPCALYNACREDWPRIDSKTAVIHVKSGLRTSVKTRSPDTITKKPYDIWCEYAEAAGIENYWYESTKAGNKVPTIKRKGAEIYKYNNYDDYLQAQNHANIKSTINKQSIQHLCASYLKLKLSKQIYGICHGAGNGNEIDWMKAILKGAKIIGTDIKETQNKNVIIFDFNKVQTEWDHKFDFIFTSSLNHVYNPSVTFPVWINTLKHNGIIIVQHMKKNERLKSNQLTPFIFDTGSLINSIKMWTNGEFNVTRKIEPPSNRNIKSASEKVEFIIIERTSK